MGVRVCVARFVPVTSLALRGKCHIYSTSAFYAEWFSDRAVLRCIVEEKLSQTWMRNVRGVYLYYKHCSATQVRDGARSSKNGLSTVLL